jgi:hypothetical protein
LKEAAPGPALGADGGRWISPVEVVWDPIPDPGSKRCGRCGRRLIIGFDDVSTTIPDYSQAWNTGGGVWHE